mmetsp:Transcript_34137/g.36884  ORF Transcript_34137/g.36884 Transcript_34137/m.36884 type:complete len:269 (+) Transcript_34137:317-1123(+)
MAREPLLDKASNRSNAFFFSDRISVLVKTCTSDFVNRFLCRFLVQPFVDVSTVVKRSAPSLSCASIVPSNNFGIIVKSIVFCSLSHSVLASIVATKDLVMVGAAFVPVVGAGADSTEAYAVGPVDVDVGVGVDFVATIDDPKEGTAAAPPQAEATDDALLQLNVVATAGAADLPPTNICRRDIRFVSFAHLFSVDVTPFRIIIALFPDIRSSSAMSVFMVWASSCCFFCSAMTPNTEFTLFLTVATFSLVDTALALPSPSYDIMSDGT